MKKKTLSLLVGCAMIFQMGFVDRAYADTNGYVSFKYDNFDSGSLRDLMKLNGDADYATDSSTNVLRLTPSSGDQNGSAYYTNYVSLSNQRSFSTFFTFKMSSPVSGGADGIVFVLNNKTNSIGSSGGGIGYSGIQNSLGIEFDSYNNGSENGDTGLGADHIAVNVNGDVDSPVATAAKSNFGNYTFQNGTKYYVWVDYEGSNHELTVKINTTNNRASAYTPIDTTAVDLSNSSVFNSDNVYAGFTAATGGSYENHDIDSWYFYNDYQPIDTANDSYTQLPTGVAVSNELTSTTSASVTTTVTNADGSVASNIDVDFSVESGNGTLSSTSATTDENGQATVIYTDSIAESSNIKATASGGAYGVSTITTIGNPSSVGITRDEDTLTAQLKYENGDDYTTSAAVTYEWYRDGESIQSSTDNTYSLTSDDEDTSITVKAVEYGLESDPIDINDKEDETTPSAVTVVNVEKLDDITVENGTDKYDIDLPETIDIDLSDETTTSAAVTWDYSGLDYDEDESGIYTFKGILELPDGITNPNNLKASVDVIVQAAKNNNTDTSNNDSDSSNSAVVLAEGSLGKAGDGKITGLTSGVRYYIVADGTTYYVKADGTLSTNKSDLGYLVGTEITGLNNKTSYCVYKYVTSSSSHHSSSTTSTSDTTSNQSNSTTNTSNVNNNTVGWTQDTTGNTYLVKEDGSKTKGWKLVDNKWYFFNNHTGEMVTGWYKSEGGDWSYDGKDTVGQWFHLGADGKMDTGWFKDANGSWYYLCEGKDYGALGYMETGWKYIGSKWYYFNTNGAMASNTTVDGYTLGSDGSLI